VRVRRTGALIVAVLVAAAPAAAEITLPPGFSYRLYVTGEGFDASTTRVAPGLPATSTLAFDREGVLYLARTGRRYMASEEDGLQPVFRIPAGGARIRSDAERRWTHGPPLWNPQVWGVRGGRELFVTTFDRDRRVGALYRLQDGRTELVAGGTPERGLPPLLVQPEGVAADAAGHLYVADRERGAVVKLDAAGRVLDPRWVSVTRPRLLAVDGRGQLWIGADGTAEAPWQRGPGEIWKVTAEGVASLVLRGPMPAGMGLGPGGRLYVADRHAARIFVLDLDGKPVAFAGFTDGDAPRALGFAPDTPETRRAGLAGDLFVVTISRGAWPVNDVLRVSGPFEELVTGARR